MLVGCFTIEEITNIHIDVEVALTISTSLFLINLNGVCSNEES